MTFTKYPILIPNKPLNQLLNLPPFAYENDVVGKIDQKWSVLLSTWSSICTEQSLFQCRCKEGGNVIWTLYGDEMIV